jgi:hypothetical protein
MAPVMRNECCNLGQKPSAVNTTVCVKEARLCADLTPPQDTLQWFTVQKPSETSNPPLMDKSGAHTRNAMLPKAIQHFTPNNTSHPTTLNPA